MSQTAENPVRQILADRPRVLVVDDDASIRLMVRGVLEPAGFLVEEADGGRKGLRLAESFRPDVVLLDILMPEMDGFDTLKSLRKQDHGATCPVVMITGLQDPNAVELAYERGAADFVTKPINWNLLRHRLNYVLRSSKDLRAGDQDALTNALRLAGVGTWRWDPETDRLSASDRSLDLLGVRRGEGLTPKFAFARVHRRDRPRVLRILRRSVSRGAEDVLETSFRVVAPGREERLVRVRAEATQAGGGSVGLAGIVEDISERGRLAQKLHDLQSSAQKIDRLIRDLLAPPPSERTEPTENEIDIKRRELSNAQ